MLDRWMTRSAVAACVWAGLLTLPAGAHAQWIWQDSAGQRVISDMPPPAEVPDKNILRRPGPARPAPAPAATATPTAPAQGTPAEPSANTPAAPGTPGAPSIQNTSATETPKSAAPAPDSPEAKKAEQERQAIEKRNAQIMADNCQRARDSAATLQSNRRLAMVNEKGQNVVMDEAMRKAEMARLQQIIKDNCKK
jgi:hypothetical protein